METDLEISSFFQYVSNPVIYLSADLHVQKVNHSAEKLLGILEVDWLDLSYERLLDRPKGLPGVDALERALAGESFADKQNWHVQAVIKKDGSPVGLVLIASELNLEKIGAPNPSVLNILSEQLPCHIFWKDRKGRYLGCNKLMAESAGINFPNEIVGKTDFDLSWKASAKRLQKNDSEVVSSKKTHTYYESGLVGGETKAYFSMKSPLFNAQQEVIGVIGIALDVTGQQHDDKNFKKTKEKERAAEKLLSEVAQEIMGSTVEKNKTPVEYVKSIKNYYENIIACMPGNVFWIDKNSTHLGCNDNVLRMLGLKSREEYSGLTYEEMSKVGGWSKGQAESFRNDDLSVMRSGEPMLNIEEPPIPDVNGKMVYFLSNRVPLRDEDQNVVGVVGISLDITARKEAEFALQKAKDDAEAAREKAEAASQAKSNFLAVMSHELRTPLNAILGLAQVLTEGVDVAPEQVRDYGETINRSGKELLTLISDVLEYSRAEAGQLRLEQELVDIPDLVQGVREKLANKAKHKGLSLVVNIDKKLPRNMITDGQRLRQILTNLADNAIKYSREGVVEIEVSGHSNSDRQKFDVEFFVKDTGIGIPADQQATIFDEFTQVTSDQAKQYARKHGGVGLGLSIVKRFVNEMSGRINFESEEGKGTAFHCQFTLALPADDKVNTAKFKTLSRMPVLFVDDNKQRRDKWQRKLLSWGFRSIATDHARAMQEMSDSYDRGRPFPIVITSRKQQSEKLCQLTQQMSNEGRFNDILHVAVFEGRATLSEDMLREYGYAILIQECHEPEQFVDPFLAAWDKHQEALAEEEEVSLDGRRILLVEDNQLNQRVAKLLLADLKCNIDVADEGETALKKLNENTYDLALMDVGLPDISGLEVTEKFREAHPDSQLPIIALTAHALVEDKQRCFDAGMDDYAVKPLDADKLKSTIRRWIKRGHAV